MLLEAYLERTDISLLPILSKVKLNPDALATWDVMHYPDDLIYELSKSLDKKPSEIFYDLLHLENPGQIRKTASDYSLSMALKNEAIYIFIPVDYRKEQSRFLTHIQIEKGIYEFEFHPIAQINVFGKAIYEAFMRGIPKDEDYQKIEKNLKRYFVLVNDKSGTILCHEYFNQPRRM